MDYIDDRLAKIQEVVNSDDVLSDTDDPIEPRVLTLQMLDELENLDEALKGGFHLGINYLVDAIGYIRDPLYIGLLAPKGFGKTTAACCIGLYVAHQKKNVLFISVEMRPIQFWRKVACANKNIDQRVFTEMEYRNASLDKVMDSSREIQLLNYRHKEVHGGNLNKMEQIIRREHRKKPLDLVIVDYLQKFRIQGSNRQEREQLSEVSARLQTLKGELGVTVLACLQINREGIKEKITGASILEHISGTSGIEQDLDVAIHFSQLNKTEDHKMEVVKCRHGSTEDAAAVNYNKETGRIE